MKFGKFRKSILTCAAVLSAVLCVSTVSYAGETGMHAAKNEPGITLGSTTNLFGGGMLMMLANQGNSQMESFVLKSKSGRVIVVDGGTDADEEHLKDVIKSNGSVVTAWLITHPHSDHVGALTKLLNEDNSGITIENIYYNFTSIDWYEANETYRAQTVADCAAAMSKLSPDALHGNVKKGDVINVDDVKITVMNSPFLFAVNAINNSSVVYRVELNGKKILFLGDLGTEAGNSFLNEYQGQDLSCDIVQVAHHGENGVTEQFYKRIKPSICLWNTPEWLWNNDNGNGIGSGSWDTLSVRTWMQDLKVRSNFVMKDGDQTLK
jgi:L-ascorbate metabolism protein UlaG (beta-lactamase superfamily)